MEKKAPELMVDYRLAELKSAGYKFTAKQLDLIRGMMVEYAMDALEHPSVKEEVYKVLMDMENEREENRGS